MMEGECSGDTKRIIYEDPEPSISSLGTEKIDDSVLERFKNITKAPLHRFLRRGLYFSHRDLNEALDSYERGEPIYVYLQRNPTTEEFELDDMVPFEFGKYIQDTLGAYIVVQVTDDKAVLSDRKLNFTKVKDIAISNIKDIISCGFNPDKTFIFLNSEYIGQMYKHCCNIARLITTDTVKKVFGFTDQTNIGTVSFPPYEAGPTFSEAFPHLFQGKKVHCIVPIDMEKDRYYEIYRDVASRLDLLKPSLVLSHSLPELKRSGIKGAPDARVAVYLSDKDKEIENKIKRCAFSGGGATIEEHRKYGANLAVDVSYKYLKIYLEDDNEVRRIEEEYGSGRMLTGEVKKTLFECLQRIVKEYNERKALITDEELSKFMQLKHFSLEKVGEEKEKKD